MLLNQAAHYLPEPKQNYIEWRSNERERIFEEETEDTSNGKKQRQTREYWFGILGA